MSLVYFHTFLNNSYQDFVLNNVLYILCLDVNLISLRLLQKDSSSIRSLRNGLIVINKNKNLLYAVMDGDYNIYYFIKQSDRSKHTVLMMLSKIIYL